jgi:hypothetical protein
MGALMLSEDSLSAIEAALTAAATEVSHFGVPFGAAVCTTADREATLDVDRRVFGGLSPRQARC